MALKTYFPFLSWVFRKLTGRAALRTYFVAIFVMLSLTATARLRAYFMARKIHAVLQGMAGLRIDQTTEEQLLKTVPYLTRSKEDWKVGNIVCRWYYTEITNGSDRVMTPSVLYPNGWLGQFAGWLGYRFVAFDASVLVQEGKVSSVRYGLAANAGEPRAASYIVSVKSVHTLWLPYQGSFEVTSQDDDSPQYRIEHGEWRNPIRNEHVLHATLTSDAPLELTRRAFQLDLSCLWGFAGCDDAREIAPELAQDVRSIQAAALKRLEAGKCPESIIEGRMRYLPDVTVLLLEVTGSRRIEVNEDGSMTEDWFTDYELKEVIRGRNSRSWRNVRFQRTIPSPVDSRQRIANQNWPQTTIGSQILYFGNLWFDSCRFIPATPSALVIARSTPTPPKRPEDQIQKGLL